MLIVNYSSENKMISNQRVAVVTGSSGGIGPIIIEVCM